MYCTGPTGYSCTPKHGTGLTLNMNFNAENQIWDDGDGVYQYDSAGNLIQDGTHGYHYNLENQITCMVGPLLGTCDEDGSANYTYGPDGRRVAKWVGNEVSEEYIYDFAGNQTSAHSAIGTVLRNELYVAGGRHVATYETPDLVNYYWYFNHADWLGTERVRTNSGGTAKEWCTDTPYGMNLNCTTTVGDPSPMHFTGKQRDGESGLDHYGARYFGGGNNLGRFMTADDPLLYQDRGNPQTINLYGGDQGGQRRRPREVQDGHGDGDAVRHRRGSW